MSRVGWAGAVAFVLAALFAATGSFKEESGYFRAELTTEKLTEYLLLVAVILVVTVLIFWLVVRRALGGERSGIVGSVLGLLGILSVVVFWSGLPAIFGTGGTFLGMEARDSAMGKGWALAAIVLGAAAIVLGAWAVIVG